MRDRQQRAGEARQPLRQPRAAVGVEVVGGLVEQQHGRLAQQHRGQQAARGLAAGDAAEQRAAVEVLDAQPAARLVQARLQRPAAERLEARLRLAVGVEVGQVGLERVEPQPHLPHLAEGACARGRRSSSRVEHVLRQVADAIAGAERDRAAIRTIEARQQADQRRLADAVDADQRGARAVVEREGDAVEQRRAVVGLREIGAFEHGGPRCESGTGHAGAGVQKRVAREQRHATARPAVGPDGQESVRWLATSLRRRVETRTSCG